MNEGVLTAEDVAALNRGAVERSAWFARMAGTALAVFGVIGIAGWVWLEVRLQQHIGGSTPSVLGGFGQSNADLVDRVDVFTQDLTPGLIAAAVAGIGFAIRAFADYSIARMGGTLTGFVEGDEMELEPLTTEDAAARSSRDVPFQDRRRVTLKADAGSGSFRVG